MGRRSAIDWNGRAGFRALVPGYPQWDRGERGRSLVLFGSFASSMAVGGFAWGTWVGLAILLLAYGAHVTSLADAIRQGAFPGFGRWVPWATASAGLGFGCYGPALAAALVVAWPGYSEEDEEGRRRGFAIDRRAYWVRGPSPGDWAWLRLPGRDAPEAFRVLAGAGQAVGWSEAGLRVDGERIDWSPDASVWRPRELTFRVPDGHVLVGPEVADRDEDADAPAPGCGLVLVSTRQVLGRAWAQLYPIRERSLLP